MAHDSKWKACVITKVARVSVIRILINVIAAAAAAAAATRVHHPSHTRT
jgi:hypothetical protein